MRPLVDEPKGKAKATRGIRITARGRAALRPTFVVGVNDCSPGCTCGVCVMKRLRRRGKLAHVG